MTTKACTKCGVAKPLDRFHRNKRSKFGRRADCKECAAARRRAHYESNREKENARHRAYVESNREKVAAYKRAHYEDNREKMADYKRAYRELIGAPAADKCQEISLKHATRNREPWSEEEDRYLANSTARAIDDALALHRTYNSVNARRLHLYRAGVIEKQYA